MKPRSPKAPRRPRPVRYGPGGYAPAPNGRGYDCAVSLNGVRSRSRQPDEAAARVWIDGAEASAAMALPPLTRAQMLDARQALALLPPGVTLADCSRRYLATLPLPPPSVPLSSARDAFIADRAESGTRPVTYRHYRQTVNRLIRAVGDVPVAEVTREKLSALVGGMSATSRNTALSHLSAFLNWCRQTGRAPGNPAETIRKARLPEPPKGVLTPDQISALMACARVRRPGMVPYLALAFFAGIRPDELARLHPSKIGPRFILLDGSVTKNSATRSVSISPHLADWLKAYPPAAGRAIPPLSPKHLYAALRLIRADTVALSRETQTPAYAVRAWPKDCPRHSYATYMYDLTKNAAAVAAEMGHKGVDVFFRHYRALSHPGDGSKFTAITPESVKPLTTICQRLSQPVEPQQSQLPS